MADGKTVEEIQEQIDLRRKNVQQGMLIERLHGAARELRRDLFGIFLDGLRQQANIIYMAEPILKAHALVRDDLYLAAAGDARQDFWLDVLDTLARDGRFPRSKAEWVMDKLRKNMSVAVLTYKPYLPLLQASSLGPAAAMIGGGYVKQGIFAGPEWDGFVGKNMPLIRDRKGGDPAVRDVLEGSLLPGVKEAGFKHVVAMDYWTAEVAALGAYFQYLDVHAIPRDPAIPNREALSYAQGTVGRAMASWAMVDSPLVMSRGGPIVKSLFQFQSETMSKLGIMRQEIWGKFRDDPVEAARKATFVSVSILYEAGLRHIWRALALGILYAVGAISKEDYDKAIGPESLAKQIAMAALGSVPLVGQVGNNIMYDSGFIPVVDTVSNIGKGAFNLGDAVVNGKPIKGLKALTEALTATAALAGVPGSGLAGWFVKQAIRGQKDEPRAKAKGSSATPATSGIGKARPARKAR